MKNIGLNSKQKSVFRIVVFYDTTDYFSLRFMQVRDCLI